MILKLLIDFYRWLWRMPPLVVQPDNEPMVLAITFGALIDISAIVGIVGLVLAAYNDRKKSR